MTPTPELAPSQLTTFVGRQNELAELMHLLLDPDCRLLTLLGQGGMGKTRLALEVTAVAADEFSHGAVFIPLQAVASADLLISTIADKLGVLRSDEPAEQVRHHLHDKEMVVVLDNFEHLLDGAASLTTLLQAAPGLKLLVTSREVLNLQEEWHYVLHGLPFPSSHSDDWSHYSAMQLFVERARRVRPSFDAASEIEDILTICQLVEGIPLALELAAAWTKTLSCQAIAQEIRQNIAFLSTKLRNVPARHRSMRAVFEQSWQQLSPSEQQVFQKLSAFNGNFQQEAAKIVAGATTTILADLVDKSLLRWSEDGRYHIHELLCQYATEQLNRDASIAQQTRSRHGYYYAAFLAQRTIPILGHNQVQIVQEMAAEIQNIRSAWRWAMSAGQTMAIAMMTETFYYFGDFQGRFRETTKAFEEALTHLRHLDEPLTMALLYTSLGWNYIRLGEFDKSRAAFNASQTIYTAQNEPPPPGFGSNPEIGLALLDHIVGNYAAAQARCEHCTAVHQANGDEYNLQIILYISANVYFSLGQYERAWKDGQTAYALTLSMGNGWMRAYIHIVLGDIARAQGDYEQAQKQYQASYDLKQALNDPEGMAAALTHLAKLAWLQKDYAEAAKLHEENLTIYRQIHDQGGLVRTLQGIGETKQALGDLATAVAQYHQALEIAHQMAWEPLMLSLCASVASLYHQIGAQSRAAELAAFVYHHPVTEQETKDQTEKLFGSTLPRSKSTNLTNIVTTTLADLNAPLPDTTAEQPTALLDPLTPRELEVLYLIADGHSNRIIAEQLVITIGTVKSYTSQIYSKLGVSSRTQAVAQARDIGLIP